MSNSRNLSPAMNNSHWQTWPFPQPSLGNQQQQPFIPFPIPLQPLSQPPITPAGGLGYAQQTPSWGRSLPMRYQNSYGRRQAAAPYTLQPTRHESLGSIGRDHPTGAYLGMAHTGNSDSGAGGVWRPQPVIEEKQQTQCWIQFGTDHSGPWFSLEEGRTDSVHVLYFEVTYDDPERIVPEPPSTTPESTSVSTTDTNSEPAPSTSSGTTAMLTPSTNPDVPRRPVNDDDDTVSLGSE